jgi:hypothetical protein
MKGSPIGTPHRRKFPRKSVDFKIGVLVKGQYFIAQAQEIGEGGISFLSEWDLREDQSLVLNFFLTPMHFFSQTSVIRNTRMDSQRKHLQIIGCEFLNPPFEMRRCVRLFVNESLDETVTLLGAQSPSRL